MVEWSAYRSVWVFVMFDLPVDTPEARKLYTDFRSFLLNDGFSMIQYSVYARYCASNENADAHVGRIKRVIPPLGEVRILQITEKQFQRMQIFHGKIRKPPEEKLEQLLFF